MRSGILCKKRYFTGHTRKKRHLGLIYATLGLSYSSSIFCSHVDSCFCSNCCSDMQKVHADTPHRFLHSKIHTCLTFAAYLGAITPAQSSMMDQTRGQDMHLQSSSTLDFSSDIQSVMSLTIATESVLASPSRLALIISYRSLFACCFCLDSRSAFAVLSASRLSFLSCLSYMHMQTRKTTTRTLRTFASWIFFSAASSRFFWAASLRSRGAARRAMTSSTRALYVRMHIRMLRSAASSNE